MSKFLDELQIEPSNLNSSSLPGWFSAATAACGSCCQIGARENGGRKLLVVDATQNWKSTFRFWRCEEGTFTVQLDQLRRLGVGE